MAPIQPNESGINPQLLLNTFIDKRSIQLVSVLGVGAYGVVFLGVHVPTSRRYAVKLVTKPDAAANEIRLHSRVSGHPGVLTLEKVVREHNRTYLVLEYATGGDLFSAITQQQGLAGNSKAIRHVFLQIIDAVQHCHDKGIAHRDLKPENILMFSNMQVKLADFGLATTQHVSAEFGCGSSFYFSPECQGQLIKNNERVKGYGTRQNDIWSLGIILINLAAGRNPWRQATMKDATFSTYVKKPQGFFKTILPSISEELNQLLIRIFCLDPAHRISLPELRLRIACMASFTEDPITCTRFIPTKPVKTVQQQKQQKQSDTTGMAYSDSLLSTLHDYLDGFDVEDEPKLSVTINTTMTTHCPPPTSRLPPTPPCLLVSSCSPSTSPCSSVSSLSSVEYYPRTLVDPTTDAKAQHQEDIAVHADASLLTFGRYTSPSARFYPTSS